MADAPNLDDIPVWPTLSIELHADGRVRVDGERVDVPPGADARTAAIQVVGGTAALIGRPVRAEAREADGTVWPLVVTPDGRAFPAGPARVPANDGRRTGRRAGIIRRKAPNAPRGGRPVPTTPTHTGAPQPPPAPTRSSVPPNLSAPGPDAPYPPTSHHVPGDMPVGTEPTAPSAPVAPTGVARVGPVPASARAASAAPPSDVPPPDAETARALAEISEAMHRGRPHIARGLAAKLVDRLLAEHGEHTGAVDAAREVLAYVSFVSGYHIRAGRIYAQLAESRIVGAGGIDSWGEQLVDNAHFSWLQAGDNPSARELGERVVALRESEDPGCPAAVAARRRLAASPGSRN